MCRFADTLPDGSCEPVASDQVALTLLNLGVKECSRRHTEYSFRIVQTLV